MLDSLSVPNQRYQKNVYASRFNFDKVRDIPGAFSILQHKVITEKIETLSDIEIYIASPDTAVYVNSTWSVLTEYTSPPPQGNAGLQAGPYF